MKLQYAVSWTRHFLLVLQLSILSSASRRFKDYGILDLIVADIFSFFFPEKSFILFTVYIRFLKKQPDT